VCEEIGWLEGRKKWSHLHGVGAIFCEIGKNGKTSKQVHYFIYSCSGMTASQLLEESFLDKIPASAFSS